MARRARKKRKSAGYRFLPRVELLEDRRMLAIVLVTTDVDTIDASDGVTSLREAVLTANATSGDDVIEFDFGSSGPKTISLQQGEIEITEGLTINGLGSSLLTIDARHQSRVFNVTTESGDFAFDGLTLANGQTAGDNSTDATGTISGTLNNGGAIRSMSYGVMTLDDMKIENSRTMGYAARGGALFARGAVTMTASSLIGNSTSGQKAEGGGLCAIGNLTMVGCTVRNNRAYAEYAYGGGISNTNYSATVSISDSVIEGNSAMAIGGGVSAWGTLQLTRSTISGNSTTGGGAHGGGVYARHATVTDCLITNNSATGTLANGGGLNASAYAKIIRSTIANNLSGQYGGGIRVLGEPTQFGLGLIVQDSAILDNVAMQQGGGISVIDSAVIEHSVIARNHALADESVGGGVRSQDLTVRGSLFDSNDASGAGALYGGNVTIIGSSFKDNRGIAGAGGAMITDGAATIVNSTFSGNSGSNGGALAIWGGSLTLRNSTVTANVAGNAGGGIQALHGAEIFSSIVAGNTAFGGQPDLGVTGSLAAHFSIVSDNAGTTLAEAQTRDANGNLIGSSTGGGSINPMTGPFTDNGGHVFLDGSKMPSIGLQAGSPAIDFGDPAFDSADPDGSPTTDDAVPSDGRGGSFVRISNGRVDIGAFEVQVSLRLPGDFNRDGVVDNGDYVVWRKTIGMSIEAFGGADGNGDGLVGPEDYGVWRAHFGERLAEVVALPAVIAGTSAAVAEVVAVPVGGGELVRVVVGAREEVVAKPQAAGSGVGVEVALELGGASVDRGWTRFANGRATQTVMSNRRGERLLSVVTLLRGMRVTDGGTASPRGPEVPGGGEVETVDCVMAELGGSELKATWRPEMYGGAGTAVKIL